MDNGGAHHEEGNERLVHPDPYADLVIDSLVQVAKPIAFYAVGLDPALELLLLTNHDVQDNCLA